MGKSLGIAAFVILLISLPIPILGNFISLLAVLVLCGAAYHREKRWVVIVDIIAWVKMFLLSPTWHLMMFSGSYLKSGQRFAEGLGTMDAAGRAFSEGSIRSSSGVNHMVVIITVVILAAPIVILIARTKGQTAPSPEIGA